MLQGQRSEDEVRKYVQNQKAVIKRTQEKLETAKRQYRDDKKAYMDEEFKNSHPEEYRKQKKVLEEVKASIEDRIE